MVQDKSQELTRVGKTQFTHEEALDVWFRRLKGEPQHIIAADYRINAGRVSEVLTEKKHVGTRKIAEKLFSHFS